MTDLTITVGAWAELSVHHPAAETLRTKYTVPNPAYERAEDMGLSVRGIPETLEVFQQVGNTLRVPRGAAMQLRAAYPVVDVTTPGEPRPMRLAGQLRPEQEPFVDTIVGTLAKRNGTVAQAYPGFGKCHGKGTPILLFDGRVVPVEDIKVGDVLMGDDSTPRTVLSLARGRDTLFRVTPTQGDAWVCNAAHILTLVQSGGQGPWERDEVRDIALRDYLALPVSRRARLKQFAVGVAWPEQAVPLDPYFFGAWLGDGNSRVPGITSMDSQIVAAVYSVADTFGCGVRAQPMADNQSSNYYVRGTSRPGGNGVLSALQDLGVVQNKHIPARYKVNSAEVRLAVLAGLLDTDGHLVKQSTFELTLKDTPLFWDAVFLARSLGFRVTTRPKEVNGTMYRRAFISGDTARIPTRVPRKQAAPRTQRKNALRTGIQVQALGEGDYFGFTLDGNHRYLLGDFTVTHNTICGLAVAAHLGVKTLILVHKEFLMTQWVERILGTKAAAAKLKLPSGAFGTPTEGFLELTPEDVGIVQQDVCEWEGRSIVIAMAQSLVARTYDDAFYQSFGLVLVDETHNYAAPTFQSTIVQFPAACRLGLTATPKRTDGLEGIFFAHLGPVCVVGDGRAALKPRVQCVKTPVVVSKEQGDQFKQGNRPSLTKVTSFLVTHAARNAMLVRLVLKAVEKGRKVLLLSDRRAHLELLEQLLRAQCLADQTACSIDYYVGGMKLEARKRAEKTQVILATYSMAEEGLDIQALDTLFLTTPRKKIEQAVGRILRVADEKLTPVVIDLVDAGIPMAVGLARSRAAEYRRLKWTVTA